MNMKRKTTLSILSTTRELNEYFQQNLYINLLDIAQLLRGLVNANILIANNKAEILTCYPRTIKNKTLPKAYIPLIVKNTLENIIVNNKCYTAVPVIVHKELIYTIIAITKNLETGFDYNQTMILENTAALIGFKLNYKAKAEAQHKTFQSSKIQTTLNILSYSETKASINILNELKEETEGIIITSKIANNVGLAPSLIVNALRKLESATLIETKSLGMKGTLIKILNPLLLDEINKKNNIMSTIY